MVRTRSSSWLERLSAEPGSEAAPDYVYTPSMPYTAFWPTGPPKPTSPSPRRAANLTPAGQPVGTGTKIELYDAGLAPRAPGVLPNVTTLASVDNELIDINGDLIVDYPAVGHGLAIGGVIATMVPGATVQAARISDRVIRPSHSQ